MGRSLSLDTSSPRDCSRGCRCFRTEPRTSRRSRRRKRRTRELDPGVRDAEEEEEEECLDHSCREAWAEVDPGLAWVEEEPGQHQAHDAAHQAAADAHKAAQEAH